MKIDNLKVFGASLLLVGSFVLPGCNSRESISSAELDNLLEELSEETGYSVSEIDAIYMVNLDFVNEQGISIETLKEDYLTAIQKHEDNIEERRQIMGMLDELTEIEGTERVFEPGQHILVKPLDYPYDEYQIPYVDGYSIKDVFVKTYVHISSDVNLIYVNDVAVSAKATGYNENTGEYYYQKFGTPIELTNDKVK